MGAKSERRCLVPGAGERFKDCAACPQMVVVPAGSFTMGSPPDEPERAAEREDAGAGDDRAAVRHRGVCGDAGRVRRVRQGHRPQAGPGLLLLDRHHLGGACGPLLAIAGLCPGQSPPRAVRRARRCQGLRGLAVVAHGQDLPAALGSRARVRDPRRDGDAVLVGRDDLDGAGELQRQRWPMPAAPRANGGSGRCPSTASAPIPGAFTTCTATSGSGRRIAGPRRTPAIPGTAAPGPAATAAGAWCAAAPGTTRRPICALPSATGTSPTTAAACRAFALLGGFRRAQ